MKAKKLLAIFVSMAIAATAAIGIAACGGGKNNTSDDDKEHVHVYDETKWEKNDKGHWHEATCHPGVIKDYADHTMVNGECEVCHYKSGSTTPDPDPDPDPDPTPTPTPGNHTSDGSIGWYVVGTGSGTLSGVDWDNFETAMKLKDDGSGNLSITLDLYNGDYFKLVYNYAGSTDLKWSNDEWDQYSIGYIGSDNQAGNEMVGFSYDGDGNIFVLDGSSGTYTITVSGSATDNSVRDVSGGIVLNRVAQLQDKVLTSDFYIIGTVASKGMSNKWPSNSTKSAWIPLTGSDGTYTVTVTLAASDKFKIYNASTQKYYTVGNNVNELADITGYTGEHTITVTTTGSGTGMIVDVAIS